MITRNCFAILISLTSIALHAGDAPAPPSPTPPLNKPVLKIMPGQVIVPTDRMRRLWGELVSIDPATRTGTFRNESSDLIVPFTVLPYSELLHHATFGDLQDFRIGERALFRMHENEAGEWTWLTYIQDEMNFLNNHKEYYYVDAIDAARSTLNCTDANFDKSFVREKEISILTNADTHFWKGGEPAKFADIKEGDKIRTKTHGIGKGKVRMCWDVFLDDESFTKFQNEQKAVHAKRMADEGAPGYIDAVAGNDVSLTLFQEGGEIARKLKAAQKIKVATAGVNRKAPGAPLSGTITEAKMAGNLGKVTLKLDEAPAGFEVKGMARLWILP